jgi:hypothetical protein
VNYGGQHVCDGSLATPQATRIYTITHCLARELRGIPLITRLFIQGGDRPTVCHGSF